MKRLVVVGDALLDHDVEGKVERLCPDAPVPVVEDPIGRFRPGGAALAATLLALDGRQVTLVTALGHDQAARELARLLDEAAVEVLDLGTGGVTAEKVRVLAGGRPLLRVDYGGGGGPRSGPITDVATAALRAAGAVLVADYGRGVTAEASVWGALARLSPRTPLVWDPHPRGHRPVAGVRLATPNRAEAQGFASDVPGDTLAAVATRARLLAKRWGAAWVAVTMGERGALLVSGEAPPLVVPATPVVGDPCGAGDRFASTAASLLADGALPSEAVVGAVEAASGFVARGGARGIPIGRPADPEGSLGGNRRAIRSEGAARVCAGSQDAGEVVRRVRARGGTVVATGGCFDLLHAGHLSILRGARALGDCLVVCLNSDGSVRRLKAPDRPLVSQGDRAALLEALACVDAVVVFDEDTPEAVLERLRPDVFVKGGDYAVGSLPETPLLERWGGQVVVLPYVEGRSTTRLLEEAVRRGG